MGSFLLRSWVCVRITVCTLVSLCAVAPARADEGRMADYPAGARAMALGGAFAALADDATGIFYNPAGIVDVRTPRVNVSTSLYGLELIGASPVENDLLRRGVTPADLIIVPSSTGYASGVGDRLPSGAWPHAFAFGTLVPEHTSRYVEQTPTDVRGTRFRSALTDRRLHAGAAWASRFGPWLRVGAAAHYVLRTLDAEESYVSGALDAPGAFVDASTRLRASSQAVRAVLGAKLWLGPRTTLGLAVSSPGFSFFREARLERIVASSRDGDDASLDVRRVSASGFEAQSDLPGSARLGIAFVEPGSFTFAADVSGYLPSRYDVVRAELLPDLDLARVPIPLVVERGPLVNVAAGIDKFVLDDLSVGIGVFTNFTSAPPLQVDGDGVLTASSSRLSRVHMLGGALSLGFHGRFGVSRIGVTGCSGFGQMVEPASPSARLAEDGPALIASEATQTLLYVFFSSTFRFGEDSARRDTTL